MSNSFPPGDNTVVGVETKTDIETHTCLRGPWLVLARIGWSVLVTLSLGLFFVSIPGYYQRLRTLSPSVISDPAAVRVGLAHLGLSTDYFASYNFVIALILILVSCIVAGIIVWYKSDDWMALLVAFVMIMYGPMLAFPNSFPGWTYTVVLDLSLIHI